MEQGFIRLIRRMTPIITYVRIKEKGEEYR
jgi:hypothetical protein